MKFLHTSDLHIGSPLTSRLSQDKVRERKNELMATFEGMIEEAVYQKAVAFIIAGDMFDSEKYGNSISEYMTIPPDIIAVNDSMQVVLDKFESSHAWNLPVVDESNQYIGFVSKSKIFSAYRNQLIEISHN